LSDIDAEVRYAARYEYAQSAVDVIARRTRLSFLNAQAALVALPSVVDILGEELSWDKKRKQDEIERATHFLVSMGLPPTTVERSYREEPVKSVLNTLRTLVGLGPLTERRPAAEMVYSRARFDAGEIEELREKFSAWAHPVEPSVTQTGGMSPYRIPTRELFQLVKDLPGFEGVKPKDYDYVLEEAGFAKQSDIDFDEFVEVSIILFLYLVCLMAHLLYFDRSARS
jgi:glycerol-3-phosphate dehydrogenase